MRIRSSLLALVGAIVLVAVSCSSTTTVQSGERLPIEETAVDPSTTPTPDTSDRATTSEARDASDAAATAEQLSSLVADCMAESDLACDILFVVSDFESDEEAIAILCGGRGPSDSGFCTAGVSASSEELLFDDDSPGLAALADDCIDGDMTACDFLFFRSEVGSEYEELGNGCGNRLELAIPDCRTAFPD